VFTIWWIVTPDPPEAMRSFQVRKKNKKSVTFASIFILIIIMIKKLKDNKYYLYKRPGLVVLGDVMVIMLAIGPKVCGLKLE
jgi:hypothetical protein